MPVLFLALLHLSVFRRMIQGTVEEDEEIMRKEELEEAEVMTSGQPGTAQKSGDTELQSTHTQIQVYIVDNIVLPSVTLLRQASKDRAYMSCTVNASLLSMMLYVYLISNHISRLKRVLTAE